jgi:phospholipid-binding lipoprotein MlaA
LPGSGVDRLHHHTPAITAKQRLCARGAAGRIFVERILEFRYIVAMAPQPRAKRFPGEASIVRRRDCGLGVAGSVLSGMVLVLALGGCGTSRAARVEGALAAPLPRAEAVAPAPPVAEPAPPAADPTTNFGPRDDAAPGTVVAAPGPVGTVRLAPIEVAGGGSALAQSEPDADIIDEEYDPWEPFNEKMFAFNRGLDRWVLKPAARVYMVFVPEPWQVLISNGFDNINFVPRFVNSLLQGKWGGAGRELGRFLINSTAGIGGLFDPAKDFWGIPKSREDFGQTLGVWGSGPGPYLVLPLLEPLTVRDGVGKFVDGLMDPLSYVLPFLWTRAGMKAGDILNERALNYELFQGFEESVIDMYSAVRHAYLQRRRQLIKE